MPISINGTGTITGISAGGLPDDCITTAEIAGSAVTPAKLSGAQSGSAPIFGARAWVNFDGAKDTTGATSTSNTNRLIFGSGNVSSVLRNSIGDYTINFAVAMQDANYCCVSGQTTAIGSPAGISVQLGFNTYGTSSVKVTADNSGNGVFADTNPINVVIFR